MLGASLGADDSEGALEGPKEVVGCNESVGWELGTRSVGCDDVEG